MSSEIEPTPVPIFISFEAPFKKDDKTGNIRSDTCATVPVLDYPALEQIRSQITADLTAQLAQVQGELTGRVIFLCVTRLEPEAVQEVPVAENVGLILPGRS